MSCDLSVVIPVYNARTCLAELVRRLDAVLRNLPLVSEIVLIDDASKDGSFDELQRLLPQYPRLIVSRNAENLGQHPTLMLGLRQASGRYSVIMDCDLQDAPELIPTLFEQLQATGSAAVVVRYSNYANGLWRRLASRAYTALRLARGQRNNQPSLAVYRIFDAGMKAVLLASYVKGRLLRDIFDPAHHAIAYFDATRARRYAGRSSYRWWTLLQLALGRR